MKYGKNMLLEKCIKLINFEMIKYTKQIKMRKAIT